MKIMPEKESAIREKIAKLEELNKAQPSTGK